MKKLSVLLMLLLTVLISHSSAQLNKCSDAQNRFTACRGGAFGPSCCAALDDVAEYCPRWWRPSLRAYNKYCNNVENPPATPPPPPSPESVSAPKYGCDTFFVPTACGHQMTDFYFGEKSAITPDCCTIIINMKDSCGPKKNWSNLAIKCQGYCLNQH